MSVSHPHGSSKIQSKSWRLTLPWATLARLPLPLTHHFACAVPPLLPAPHQSIPGIHPHAHKNCKRPDFTEGCFSPWNSTPPPIPHSLVQTQRHTDTHPGSRIPSSFPDSLFSGPLLWKLNSVHFLMQSSCGLTHTSAATFVCPRLKPYLLWIA